MYFSKFQIPLLFCLCVFAFKSYSQDTIVTRHVGTVLGYIPPQKSNILKYKKKPDSKRFLKISRNEIIEIRFENGKKSNWKNPIYKDVPDENFIKVQRKLDNIIRMRFGYALGGSFVFEKENMLNAFASEGFTGTDQFIDNSYFSYYWDIAVKKNFLLGFNSKKRSTSISGSNYLYTIRRSSGSSGGLFGGLFSGGSSIDNVHHEVSFRLRQTSYEPKIGWTEKYHRLAIYGGPIFISQELNNERSTKNGFMGGIEVSPWNKIFGAFYLKLYLEGRYISPTFCRQKLLKVPTKELLTKAVFRGWKLIYHLSILGLQRGFHFN